MFSTRFTVLIVLLAIVAVTLVHSRNIQYEFDDASAEAFRYPQWAEMPHKRVPSAGDMMVRFANHIFELVAFYGMARTLQRIPTIYITSKRGAQRLEYVEQVMPGLIMKFKVEFDTIPRQAENLEFGANCCQYYNIDGYLGRSIPVLRLTGKYHQSFKYFEKYKDEILNFVAGPKQFKTLPMSSSSNFISCIHVRRADFVSPNRHSTDFTRAAWKAFTRAAWKAIRQHSAAREYLTVVMGDDPSFEKRLFPGNTFYSHGYRRSFRVACL
ncbi:unnamed protein product [Caenorhabditis bovis]|uniref:L-Fucosyltransferase n=1 Tax=Caenorhabditis bovis TaxID=2654633 RepID=A0A8S1ELG4_9PELO|nr:unnamed protein product [Caenorhabditis bovis]